jgi:DNA-binding transcriptional regulator YdaS (Cro superfamily)
MPPRKRTPAPAKVALEAAITAAGGQVALAKRLRISQQAVSLWLKMGRAPVYRVVEIEAATGIDRAQLRPDVFAVPSR